MNITDLPIDLTLYHILSDADLTPADVLGLCGQKGFVLLCRLPKVGILLMKRYYPDISIDMSNPWRQFRILASREIIEYRTKISSNDIEMLLRDSNGPNLPVYEMTRYNANDVYDQNYITISATGVPISGYHWIAGDNHYNGSFDYHIYRDRDEAIRGLWDALSNIIEEESNENQSRIGRHNGVVDYNEPIDYPETFDEFKRQIDERGYVLYHYYHILENYEYGDASGYETSIFSIHRPEFIN